MGWIDELLTATFRGVPFKVRGTDLELARMRATHKFPGSRRRSTIEYLGEENETFTVDGYLIGDDYLEQRARIVEACRRPGKGGMLVLPTFAPRPAFCDSLRVRETTDEGGMARLEFVFRQIEDATNFRLPPRPRQEIQRRAQETTDAATTVATGELELDAVPDAVREGAAASLRKIGAQLQSLDVTTGPARDVADFLDAARRLADDALSLVVSPVAAANGVLTALERLEDAAGNPRRALDAYRQLLGLQPDVVGGQSRNGRARDRNAVSTVWLARSLALAGVARAVGEIEWESRNEAEALRNALLDSFDAVLEDAEDSAFRALSRLRSAFVSVTPPDGEDLPDLLSLTFPGDLTTLHVAYRLYDDTSRDDEIRVRNRLRNPALISAGVSLEVLSR